MLKKKQEEVQKYFTKEDPYYCEMLEMMKRKKQVNDNLHNKIRSKKMEQLMQDPLKAKEN